MNHRKLQDNDRLREHLAAAYVLGTLKGGARRRFEAWIARDAVLAQTVSDWEGRLGPMAEFAPSAPPPARAWQAIEARLGLEARGARASAWQRLRESLSFWRGLSLASSAVAAVLLTVLMLQPPASTPAPSSMAMLASASGEPMVAVSGNPQQLTVRVVGAVPMTPDRSLELWAVPAQGAPQSLGLIDANGVVTIRMPPNVTPATMPVLAVSMEPKGGSPNPHAPSGPVMYKGAWMRI